MNRLLGALFAAAVVAAFVGTCASCSDAHGSSGITTQQAQMAAPLPINLSGTTPADAGVSLSFVRADAEHALTGVLPVANGGTGRGALPSCGVFQGVDADAGVFYCTSAPKCSTFTVLDGGSNIVITLPTSGAVGCYGTDWTGNVTLKNCSISGTTLTVVMSGPSSDYFSYCYF